MKGLRSIMAAVALLTQSRAAQAARRVLAPRQRHEPAATRKTVSRSKYTPHQGPREMARRVRQMS